jgi:hypothetical protein
MMRNKKSLKDTSNILIKKQVQLEKIKIERESNQRFKGKFNNRSLVK